MATDTEELLSLPEAAERLGVSVYTVRRWIKDGKLRAFKPGKEYRVRQADLEEFWRAREVRPKAPSRSPLEPSFNDALAEERRESAFDAWKDYLRERVEWREEVLRKPPENNFNNPLHGPVDVAIQWWIDVDFEFVHMKGVILRGAKVEPDEELRGLLARFEAITEETAERVKPMMEAAFTEEQQKQFELRLLRGGAA